MFTVYVEWTLVAVPAAIVLVAYFSATGNWVFASGALFAIVLLAAFGSSSRVAPWKLVWGIIHWMYIGVLVFGGAFLSILLKSFYFGMRLLSEIPWPLIAITSGIYVFIFTLVLSFVRLLQIEVPYPWQISVLTYVILIALVLWRSNK